ncbi:MAG: hypothetical protein CMJ39_03980 [Phycisphaerae bacterium]|nr:hypothetical protein [Phycisphaerae bacterium]
MIHLQSSCSNALTKRAFTLVELMVVIMILSLLAAIIFVAAGTIGDRARSAEDSARLRSIAMANMSFAVDNDNRLMCPRTQPNEGAPDDPENPSTTPEQLRRMWIHAFDDNVVEYGGAGGNAQKELESALEEGAAWEYLGDVNLYKSPFDPTTRLRSYSLNAFVGVDRCADEYPALDILSGSYNTRYRVPCPTLGQVPQPSKTICAIGEIDQGFGGFNETPNANGWLVSPNPNMPLWKDTPALWNGNRVNFSLMDGSTASPQLLNIEELRNKIAQAGSSHNILTGNGAQDKVDFNIFSQKMLPGVLEYRTAADQE